MYTTMEPITRYSVIGPGSKTFFKTKIINNPKVAIVKKISANKTNGVCRKTEIQPKRINKNGMIVNKTVCFLDLDKEIIPANKNNIQNILIIIIKEELLPNIGIRIK